MTFIIDFISYKRTQLGISKRKLSEGLLLNSRYGKIEDGILNGDKLLLDRILSRLDVPANFFEHFVSNEEYELELLRNQICDSIFDGDLNEAKNFLVKYTNLMSHTNIYTQYTNYIQLKLLEMKNISIHPNSYKKIILQTVPNFEIVNINTLILDGFEVFLILKYYDACRNFKDSLELLIYLSKSSLEVTTKRRCFIKLICSLSTYLIKNYENKFLLEMCDKAIEIMRCQQEFYNFDCILEIKITLLNSKNTSEYKNLEMWRKSMVDFCSTYNINPNNDNLIEIDCLKSQGYYNISEVIKYRRNIYGYSQSKLAELTNSIKDPRSISRVENNHHNLQPKQAQKVLKNLNLTGDLYSDNIKIDNMDMFELFSKLTYLTSNGRYEEAYETLQQVQGHLNLDIPVNLQYIKHKELTIGEMINPTLTPLEYAKELEKILAITIPTDTIFEQEHLHFTKKEVYIICLIFISLENAQEYDLMNMWINTLNTYFDFSNNKITNFNTYVFFIGSFISILGNTKKFDKSNILIQVIFQETNKQGQFEDWIMLAYNFSWNYWNNLTCKEKLSTNIKNQYLILMTQINSLSKLFYINNFFNGSLLELNNL
ncbi:MAG: hypothetical protein ATN36_05335 [Epulopiscium sp. Nele67-Bin005]|nr:MAG: hypothetical protein ATN36_05335 [Epulopiscium sp. Nele67-Bin005]